MNLGVVGVFRSRADEHGQKCVQLARDILPDFSDTILIVDYHPAEIILGAMGNRNLVAIHLAPRADGHKMELWPIVCGVDRQGVLGSGRQRVELRYQEMAVIAPEIEVDQAIGAVEQKGRFPAVGKVEQAGRDRQPCPGGPGRFLRAGTGRTPRHGRHDRRRR